MVYLKPSAVATTQTVSRGHSHQGKPLPVQTSRSAQTVRSPKFCVQLATMPGRDAEFPAQKVCNTHMHPQHSPLRTGGPLYLMALRVQVVFIYVYIHICISTHLYMHIYINMYVCLSICVSVCTMQVHIKYVVNLCVYVYTGMSMSVYTYIYIYIHMYIHIHIHIYMCILAYVHTASRGHSSGLGMSEPCWSLRPALRAIPASCLRTSKQAEDWPRRSKKLRASDALELSEAQYDHDRHDYYQ